MSVSVLLTVRVVVGLCQCRFLNVVVEIFGTNCWNRCANANAPLPLPMPMRRCFSFFLYPGIIMHGSLSLSLSSVCVRVSVVSVGLSLSLSSCCGGYWRIVSWCWKRMKLALNEGLSVERKNR